MSKYRNLKHTVNGITFDSRREARRYSELLLLEKAGEVHDIRMQVKFVLIPSQHGPSPGIYTRGEKAGQEKPGVMYERECSYLADFVYIDKDGRTVVEDVKGVRTKDYIIKRKLMLWVHGIRIREI